LDLLFEIGTEELPPSYIRPALEQMSRNAARLLSEARIEHSGISTFGTPRRLVLIARDLAEQQLDVREKVFGPPANVAFDSEGKPTQAALGFARSQGVEVEQLKVEPKGKGRYVCVEKVTAGRPTEGELPEILTKLIRSITFPKSMRWEASGLRFARPIRWILALADGKAIDIEVADVRSSDRTRGHRFLGRSEVPISGISQYLEVLRSEFVILDHEERKRIIRERIDEAARSVGGEIVEDDDLLERVTFMVEHPIAIVGTFSQDFLEMPKDVVVTALREHQDFFSVHDGKGKLIPYFVAVADTDADRSGKIKSGNERVLKARLEDALFYWHQDLRDGLTSMVERLKDVVWQEKLGSLMDKTNRLVELSAYICEQMGLSEVGKARRAALLSKADLTSNMVREKEFSALQGAMGKEYALALGEDEEVAEAIFEHYLPRSANDILPRTATGAVLAIADKVDTLVGYFGIGMIPSGSEDPYGLRRLAMGLVRILLERRLPLSLDAALTRCAELFGDRLEVDLADLKVSLSDFIRQRLCNVLVGAGNRPDMVEAVVDAGFDDLNSVVLRLEAVRELEKDERFAILITAFKRAYNITKGEYGSRIDPSNFESDFERSLYESFESVKPRFEALFERGDFKQALSVLLDLADPIDRFFENVMVMVDDERLRNTRLNLLGNITHLFLKIANFSRLESI